MTHQLTAQKRHRRKRQSRWARRQDSLHILARMSELVDELVHMNSGPTPDTMLIPGDVFDYVMGGPPPRLKVYGRRLRRQYWT